MTRAVRTEFKFAPQSSCNRVVKKHLLVPVMTLDLNHVYNTLVLGYRTHSVAGGVQGLKMDTVAQWVVMVRSTCLFWDSLYCSGSWGLAFCFGVVSVLTNCMQ